MIKTLNTILGTLAHLGISISDTNFFDIQVFSKLLELDIKSISNEENSRIATQKDIDVFLI